MKGMRPASLYRDEGAPRRLSEVVITDLGQVYRHGCCVRWFTGYGRLSKKARERRREAVICEKAGPSAKTAQDGTERKSLSELFSAGADPRKNENIAARLNRE